jgi:hypothetical protein
MTKNVAAFTLAANPAKDSLTVYTPMVKRYRKIENELNEMTKNSN